MILNLFSRACNFTPGSTSYYAEMYSWIVIVVLVNGHCLVGGGYIFNKNTAQKKNLI